MGYGYSWKLAESEKNLLRTHTTAVSSRMLYNLANQPGGFRWVASGRTVRRMYGCTAVPALTGCTFCLSATPLS